MSELLPEGPKLTCPGINPRATLDYIFHGKGLTARKGRQFLAAHRLLFDGIACVAVSGEVKQMEAPPSDHLPVVGRFRIGSVAPPEQ